MTPWYQHFRTFARHSNYVTTAEHLKVNWRTVREKLDQGLVIEYLSDAGS